MIRQPCPGRRRRGCGIMASDCGRRQRNTVCDCSTRSGLSLPRSSSVRRRLTAAAPCGGDFGTWLQGRQTGSRGATAFRSARSNRRSAGVTYDPTIIARDHAQGVFRQSFEQFSGRMVPPRLARGRQQMLAQYALAVRAASSSSSACPARCIVAIWGLETDFGADTGNFPTIRALATLAYDCRRAGQIPRRIASPRCASSIAAT